MIEIGSVRLTSNLLLSPLAGHTDLAFRLMVRPLGGLGLAFTELANPQGIKRQTARSLQIVETCPEDQPLAMQLYGTDPDEIADGAAWAADHGATIVDINMGCPVPKVAGKGGGSGLLRTCPHAVAIAAAAVKRCSLPVTVKTRLGWEMGHLVAPELARQFEDVGVAALTIHGRYGEQRFSGRVDLAGIRAVVNAVKRIPVFGNGDIVRPIDAVTMMNETGCAGVMIGRRALADQWIFRDTFALLTTGVVPEPPDRFERTAMMRRHLAKMIELYGEPGAVVQFRKRTPWYVKTIGPAPKLRRQLPKMASLAEFDALVDEFLEALAAGDPCPGRNEYPETSSAEVEDRLALSDV